VERVFLNALNRQFCRLIFAFNNGIVFGEADPLGDKI
jgi:hypothetical protein